MTNKNTCPDCGGNGMLTINSKPPIFCDTCNGMGEVEAECGRCKQLEKEISEAKKVINDCEYTYDRLTYEVPLDVSIQAILGQINEGAQEIIELDAQASIMREALKQCNLFVTNGIELGYIQMPDPCTNDPALKIPSMIHKALSLDAGKALLERVQHLEAVAEVLKDAVPPVGVDDWWCPTCKRVADGKEVTCAEYHESCGTYIGDVTNDGWIAKARQVLVALEGGK